MKMTESNISERAEVTRKLARAVLGFQDSYLARENSPVGLLCQVGRAVIFEFFNLGQQNGAHQTPVWL